MASGTGWNGTARCLLAVAVGILHRLGTSERLVINRWGLCCADFVARAVEVD
jgi:hypothetical protein